MKLLKVDSMEGAMEKLYASVSDWSLQTQQVPLMQSSGRILAEDITAPENIPSFRRSTVDGYAVVAADTAAASESVPVFLTIVDRVEMGKPARVSIRSGECAYVPTGGMLPEGADAMVMVEYSEQFGEGEVALQTAVATGSGVVQPGEDVKAGTLILKKGTRLRPQEIGALASAGAVQVEVYEPLRMFLISTGDELVPPEQAPRPGQVRDINSHALAALAEQCGYAVTGTAVLRDDPQLLEQTVRSAMAACDVVVVSGGSSQGDKDATRMVLDKVSDGGVFTHGVAAKPGKPTILGLDHVSKTLLVGLPGHPVSAMMVFLALLGGLYRRMAGCRQQPTVEARISVNLPGAPGRTTYQPVALRQDGAGWIAEPVFGKSGLMTTLTAADGYIVIDRNCEGLQQDERVQVCLM